MNDICMNENWTPWLNYVSGPRPNAPDLKKTFFLLLLFCSLLKLRRGRLNYVGGEISPETDLRYTKIFEHFATVFCFCEHSPEADLSYTKNIENVQLFGFFLSHNISISICMLVYISIKVFIYIAIYISWYFS